MAYSGLAWPNLTWYRRGRLYRINRCCCCYCYCALLLFFCCYSCGATTPPPCPALSVLLLSRGQCRYMGAMPLRMRVILEVGEEGRYGETKSWSVERGGAWLAPVLQSCLGHLDYLTHLFVFCVRLRTQKACSQFRAALQSEHPLEQIGKSKHCGRENTFLLLY